MVWREEVVLLQDRKQGLPLRAATPLGPAAFGAATRARHQRVRLRCRIPPLHALFGGVLVSTEDRLLLQELPQGLQGRGAGVSRPQGSGATLRRPVTCMYRSRQLLPSAHAGRLYFTSSTRMAKVLARVAQADRHR